MKTLSMQNNKGVTFVVSLMVITVLITLSAGYMMSVVGEFREARRYQDSSKTFWLAEAGLAYYKKNPTMLDSGAQTLNFVSGSSVVMSKDETSGNRVVTLSSSYKGNTRTIKATFPPNPPGLFDNTMSTGDDVSFTGALAALTVNGKARLAGSFSKSGFALTATFADKQEGVASTSTTLKFPDSDSSGTADEFADFKKFYQDLAATYPANEVVYIPNDGSVLLYPNTSYVGKKLVYIEGTSAGQGDVSILFDTTWQNDQNLTIVSTGTVSYIQPLQFTVNSKLNTVSWDDYSEASILLARHSGVTYAHDDANFGSVISLSTSKGSMVVNDDVSIFELASGKQFNYENPVSGGQVPPGFQGLISGGSAGFQTTPSTWQEI